MFAENDKLIKVKSIEFKSPPFRKLGSLKLDFSDRLTIVAGHNGIGKSTILGLVANTFGIPKRSTKSYFQETFSANIEKIVYLSIDEASSEFSDPIVIAKVGNHEITKRCSLTVRSEWKRARVVPRTVDKSDDDIIGQDAKIPLPTIYLGMRRLASIGEADEKEVTSSDLVMHDDDSKLMVDFINSINLVHKVNNVTTYHSITGSKKRSAHPGYQDHEPQAVSIGQDSLASIATALASFSSLKREMAEGYPGGLLIIDELDAGFHPHAIDRLVKALKNNANKLNLQIIATTHSPRLIQAVHPDGSGNVNAPDSVIYLLDSKRPKLADDNSLLAILRDMDQSDENPEPDKPVLCIYFEDLQAQQFCEAIYSSAKRRGLARRLGISIKLIDLGVGGSNLIQLPDKDPIFADRVLVVDADTTISKKARDRGNAIKLPCPSGVSGTNRSPENLIKNFLRSIIDASDGPLLDACNKFKIKNATTDRIESSFFRDNEGESNQRESSKNWWISKWDKLNQWGVIEVWAEYYPNEVNVFVEAFEKSIGTLSARL